MKLPEHVQIESLSQLRKLVDAYEGNDPEIEMTEDQYNAYKVLVYQADFIRYFDGHKIRLSTPPNSDASDSSV